MMKGLKKVISLVLAVAVVLSFNTVVMKNTVKAANVVPFGAFPTANKLVPAGHVTITWSNGNIYSLFLQFNFVSNCTCRMYHFNDDSFLFLIYYIGSCFKGLTFIEFSLYKVR